MINSILIVIISLILIEIKIKEYLKRKPLKVKLINKNDFKSNPVYATIDSSGVDLYANEEVVLKPFERILVSTGLFMAIPAPYEGQVRPRSGLAVKEGITVLNTPGTIDADYRGEVKVILINLSDKVVSIQAGDRIAQMVFTKVKKVSFINVNTLEDTQRSSGGFGHSGK